MYAPSVLARTAQAVRARSDREELQVGHVALGNRVVPEHGSLAPPLDDGSTDAVRTGRGPGLRQGEKVALQREPMRRVGLAPQINPPAGSPRPRTKARTASTSFRSSSGKSRHQP